MKKVLLTAVLTAFTVLPSLAQKTMYVPQEWRNRTDTLIYAESDPDNKYTWSKSRSRETDNCIILWDNGYGSTNPSDAPETYRVDIEDLADKAEQFYTLEINKLGFVKTTGSQLDKYKVMILLNHSDGWICYGGGYDYTVSALWLSPSTCKPVGQSVAHEIGHSFHYMCYSEARRTDPNTQTGFHSAVGNGSVTWEQTAQWQSLQSFPELMYSQSINVFRNSHNYAMTHEWQRYQSYWFFYYINQLYDNIQTLAEVWNYPETEVKDFNQVYMDLKGLSVRDLYKQYYDYAARLATWDLDVCKPYRDQYIGDFTYSCVGLGDNSYQVTLASCPQATGFNVIPLNVPSAGTTITTHFTGLHTGSKLADGDPGQMLNGSSVFADAGRTNYNSTNGRVRGFRVGYVALLKDGTRKYFNEDSVYCQGHQELTEDVSMTVPENVDRMWLIVSPAPSTYFQHKWDESFDGDDMWPYKFQLEGTTLGSKAQVYVTPTIDGRQIDDATLTYNVSFPASNGYTATAVTVSGEAAAAVCTAFQLQPSGISARMKNYDSKGPHRSQIMFYGAKADGTLIQSGSTANGYGHWFDASGNVVTYSNGVLFSEFTPSTLTFNIGVYPGKVSDGQNYQFAQALVYNDGTKKAQVTFVFNISLSDVTSVEYQGVVTGISTINAATRSVADGIRYNLQGQRVSSSYKGVYIMNGRKYLSK